MSEFQISQPGLGFHPPRIEHLNFSSNSKVKKRRIGEEEKRKKRGDERRTERKKDRRKERKKERVKQQLNFFIFILEDPLSNIE